eukprot:COSAG02_NODE_1733_length_11168_cov_29.568705_10_plen_76_part_00
MRRGLMLANGRANPLDEFNATIPGLDNMLPTLPKAIPGAGLVPICPSIMDGQLPLSRAWWQGICGAGVSCAHRAP